jgi:hypothetical protein
VQHTRVVIWLYDNNDFRIEAYLIVSARRTMPPLLQMTVLTRGQGFDEFMNVVLDDAEEVYDCSAKPGKEVKPRRELGEWELGSAWWLWCRIGSGPWVGSGRQVGLGPSVAVLSFAGHERPGSVLHPPATSCVTIRFPSGREPLTAQDAYC